jgi:transcriptional regulator with XRE-family HTH domain
LERIVCPETIQLIKLLTQKRTELHLSVNEVARRADVDPGTVWRIEQGMIAKPRAESLIAIGNVIGINAMELFTTVGWLSADELPPLGTYLSAKFPQLPDATIKDIEHYVTKILQPHGQSTHANHDPTADRCPQKANHCPQCPCSPEERPHEP